MAFVLLIVLSACGSGGGGSSVSSATNWTSPTCTGSYTNSDGVKVPCAYQTFNTTQNSTTGSYTASDYEQADFGAWSGTFASHTDTGYPNKYAWMDTCFNNINNGNFDDPTNCIDGSSGPTLDAYAGYARMTEEVESDAVSYNFDVPMHHMTDTGATTAWSEGWTGTGTNINIIDDASWNAINIDVGAYTFTREVVHGNGTTQHQYTSQHTVGYSDDMTVSHGWIVKNIAGGDKRTLTDYTANTDYKSNTITSCARNKKVVYSNGYNGGSAGTPYYTVTNDSTSYTSTTDKAKFCEVSSPTSFFAAPTWSSSEMVISPGVAKDATMTTSNVDLSPYQNPSTTWAYIKGFMENSTSFDAVNLSLGLSINSNTYNWAYLKENSEIFSFSGSPSGVYVIAAGNESAPCTSSNFARCNLLAGIMTLNSSLKNNTIVAGATDMVSGVKTIATYSNQAGVMRDRYLMANGDSGWDKENSTNTGDDLEGTSFAAPRIAGAAAIVKSKFPNLTGANVANILLLTADKDINDDGSDDFNSVSSIYGRGELDLSSALSPVGNLTP